MQIAVEHQVRISDLQFQINLWLNDFHFYKKEILIFNRKLEKIISLKSDAVELTEVEHFQNQFIRQNEVIDELRHDVKQHENAVEDAQIRERNVEGERLNEDHDSLAGQVERFKEIYAELRADFLVFARQ